MKESWSRCHYFTSILMVHISNTYTYFFCSGNCRFIPYWQCSVVLPGLHCTGSVVDLNCLRCTLSTS